MRVAPYLRLARFPLVFTAVADSAAGYLLSGEGSIDPLTMAMLAMASACLYACGMVFNDVADLPRDRAFHPERPLPSGQVTPQAARTFGIALMFAGAACALVVSFMTVHAVLFVFALILAYDFYAKRSALGGSLVMALTRGANFLVGVVAAASAGGGRFALPSWEQGAYEQSPFLAAYVFCLTWVSTMEEKALRRGAFLAEAGCMSLAVLAPQALAWSWASLALAGAVAVALFAHALSVSRSLDRAGVMRQVRWGVLAIIALDASMVMPGSAAGGLAVLALAAPALAAPALALLPVFRRL